MSTPILERGYFEALNAKAQATRRKGEHFFLNFAAESSQFIRLNGPRVRQIGSVEDAELSITLVLESGQSGEGDARGDGSAKELRTASASTTLTGLSYLDQERVNELLATLRSEVPQLPVDPYAILPQDHGSSEQINLGRLPSLQDAAGVVLEPLSGLDVAGIYAAGTIVRAMANTAGQVHWFSTQNFSLDYSLYTPAQKALKGTFAGSSWDAAAYRAEIVGSRQKLALLDRPARKLARGTYRAYLEPAAYSDLVLMLNWGGVSEAAIRQGDSPLRLMRAHGGGSSAKSDSKAGQEGGEIRKLSPLFTLSEDFAQGQVPRFNGEGELAPEHLAVIERGNLAHSLVSSRTALEYKTVANGAEEYEALRAPSISPGTMPRSEALKRLGTGLHLSNLHYLNWSDQPGGRVTGMTRYACFWVENGEIVAPIENLRFDDSIFNLCGSALEALSVERAFLPDVHTYESRSLGGVMSPGALLGAMEFTL